MQYIIHNFYIHTKYMSCFHLFLRIDSVNTALGPLGIHISATICNSYLVGNIQTPALAIAGDFCAHNPLFHEIKCVRFSREFVNTDPSVTKSKNNKRHRIRATVDKARPETQIRHNIGRIEEGFMKEFTLWAL